MGPREILCILTPQSPLSWVSESFRQDISSLSKSFSRFQLGKFKVFELKIYLSGETGMDPRLEINRVQASKSRGQLLCTY